MTEPQFRQTFGRTSRDIIAFLWPGQFTTAESVRAFDEEKEAAYRDLLDQNFPAMAGAVETLRVLKGAGFRLVGENIAMGQPNAREAVRGWLASPGHRQNIENCGYTRHGVGLREGR